MKIAFLGDSITKGHTLEDEKKRYSTLLCDAVGAEELNLGITGTLVANAGLSKDVDPEKSYASIMTNAGFSVDRKPSFITRINQMRDADYAVVFGGTNDYYWSDTPIYEEKYSGSVNYFANAMDMICSELLTRFSAENILFITPYVHHGCGNFWGGETWLDAREHDTEEKNYLGHRMSDYVNAIKSMCDRKGVKHLDLYRRGFDWKNMTTDGCHPNEAGHQWICDQLFTLKMW